MDVRSCVRSESGRVGAGDPEENRNLQFSCWTLDIDGIVFRMCRRVPLRSFEVPSTRRPPTVKKSQFSTPLVQPARDTTWRDRSDVAESILGVSVEDFEELNDDQRRTVGTT